MTDADADEAGPGEEGVGPLTAGTPPPPVSRRRLVRASVSGRGALVRPRAGSRPRAARVGPSPAGEPGGAGYPGAMFFFSNRVGCIGSLVISAVATVVLVLLLKR
ncbi:hypothetical protein ACFW4M_17705 [Streptomyces sp. NPDC058794]|uniref:hypothetical protein n=1 Tax=unclassified Streptomyces TaxID=2593676 RepID=UPI003689317E